jgi:hypothetical protein
MTHDAHDVMQEVGSTPPLACCDGITSVLQAIGRGCSAHRSMTAAYFHGHIMSLLHLLHLTVSDLCPCRCAGLDEQLICTVFCDLFKKRPRICGCDMQSVVLTCASAVHQLLLSW